MINGINILITEFKLPNNNFPWLAKIQNTASDRNQICSDVNKSVAFCFNSVFNINLTICAATNGITITINREYASWP